MSKAFIVIVTIILTAAATFGITFYFMDKNTLRDLAKCQTEIEQYKSEQTLQSATPTPSSTATSSAQCDQAKIVAAKFMDAKKTRSLDNAKPYMTNAFVNSTDQATFAGVSSPTIGRYTVESCKSLDGNAQYQVSVRAYQNLQNEEVGYVDFTLNILNENNKYLVNKSVEGDFQETK